jgi:prepilin-type N-terminal cleavage/methylation domain-containing protein
VIFRRGYTLIEILIGAALLLLIMGLLSSVLVPGMRAWSRSEKRSEAQQNALLVASRLSRELQFSNPDSIALQKRTAVDPQGRSVRRDAIVFLSNLDDEGAIVYDADGDQLWQRRLVFYHRGDSNEVRSQVLPLDPPVDDPDPLKVNTFEPTVKDRVVARGVRSLSFEAPSFPIVQIRVETEIQGFVSVMQAHGLPVAVGSMGVIESPSPTP